MWLPEKREIHFKVRKNSRLLTLSYYNPTSGVNSTRSPPACAFQDEIFQSSSNSKSLDNRKGV